MHLILQRRKALKVRGIAVTMTLMFLQSNKSVAVAFAVVLVLFFDSLLDLVFIADILLLIAFQGREESKSLFHVDQRRQFVVLFLLLRILGHAVVFFFE